MSPEDFQLINLNNDDLIRISKNELGYWGHFLGDYQEANQTFKFRHSSHFKIESIFLSEIESVELANYNFILKRLNIIQIALESRNVSFCKKTFNWVASEMFRHDITVGIEYFKSKLDENNIDVILAIIHKIIEVYHEGDTIESLLYILQQHLPSTDSLDQNNINLVVGFFNQYYREPSSELLVNFWRRVCEENRFPWTEEILKTFLLSIQHSEYTESGNYFKNNHFPSEFFDNSLNYFCWDRVLYFKYKHYFELEKSILREKDNDIIGEYIVKQNLLFNNIFIKILEDEYLNLSISEVAKRVDFVSALMESDNANDEEMVEAYFVTSSLSKEKPSIEGFYSWTKKKYSYTNHFHPATENLSDHRYDKYGGAHGFDDDTIDNAFEGDPDNYWNID